MKCLVDLYWNYIAKLIEPDVDPLLIFVITLIVMFISIIIITGFIIHYILVHTSSNVRRMMAKERVLNKLQHEGSVWFDKAVQTEYERMTKDSWSMCNTFPCYNHNQITLDPKTE